MLTIIGCGNTNRCDDGAGVIVAQRMLSYLQHSPIAGVQIFDAGTSGMDIMFQARGSHALIIIDASASGSEPGSIFKVPGLELANIPEPSYNLHDFRWDHALFAGKKIFGNEFPEDVTVYLIEAQCLGLGLELSSTVADAVDRVVQMITKRLESA